MPEMILQNRAKPETHLCSVSWHDTSDIKSKECVTLSTGITGQHRLCLSCYETEGNVKSMSREFSHFAFSEQVYGGA